MSGAEVLRARARAFRYAAQNPPTVEPVRRAVQTAALAAAQVSTRSGGRTQPLTVRSDAKSVRVSGRITPTFLQRLSAELPRARAEILRQAKERLK